MKQDTFYIFKLIIRYFKDESTKKERAFLEPWMATSGKRLMDKLMDRQLFTRQWNEIVNIDKKLAWKKLQDRIPELRSMNADGSYVQPDAAISPIAKSGRRVSPPRGFVWGALSLITALIGFIVLHLIPSAHTDKLPVVHQTLAPAGYNATLRLADGTDLRLADLSTGPIGQSGCLSINKQDKGSISLSRIQNCSSLRVSPERSPVILGTSGVPFNTLTTPKGGLFTMTLPDGTRVQLNAASSLRFPTSFDGPSREVMLEGEAYFDVTTLYDTVSGSKEPFVVYVNTHDGKEIGKTNMLKITCRGTRFDVRAYDDDPDIYAALDEGKIELEKDGQELKLTPGQVALLDQKDSLTREENQPGASTSWKDGEFDIRDQPLDVVLRELSRWYDFTIVYQGDKPMGIYGLQGHRAQPLKDVLRDLSKMGGFHFNLQKDTVVISH